MVRFGREESPCTFAPAFERGSDDKDEMLEERTVRVVKELGKAVFFLVNRKKLKYSSVEFGDEKLDKSYSFKYE